jgi:hypothetical protein
LPDWPGLKLVNRLPPRGIVASSYRLNGEPPRDLAARWFLLAAALPAPRTCDQFRGLDLKRIRDPPEHGVVIDACARSIWPT